MRKIKFRGQRVDNKEWVYGSYTQMREEDHNECFRTEPHKTYHRIWQWEAGDWNMGGYANYEVIPETVGQFTGLKDKNWVEIYEGDIFHLGDKNITYTVVWHDTGLRGKQNGASNYVGIEHWKRHIEIIGNIHDKNKQKQALIDMMRGDEELELYDDNPELLK